MVVDPFQVLLGLIPGLSPLTPAEIEQIDREEEERKKREEQAAIRAATYLALPTDQRLMTEEELHRELSRPINRSPLTRAAILAEERAKLANAHTR